MAYHDSRKRGDRAEAGEACGVTGVQHERNHAADAGCHEAGIQGVACRKHQGGAVQDTCKGEKKRDRKDEMEGSLKKKRNSLTDW